MTCTRRSLLGSAIAAVTLPGSARAGQSHADYRDPAVRIAAIARMRSSPSGTALWWYRGTFFGKPEGEMTRPLMRIDGASRVHFVADGAGRYRASMDEAGFFSDLGTGERLRQWRNPWNGRLVTPEPYRSAATFAVTADAVTPLVELPPEVEFRGQMTPFVVHGDSAWVSEELFLRSPSPESPESEVPRFRVQTSLATFHSRLSELEDPAIDFVPCELNYSTLASWRDWMQMGERPGVISWRLVGQKARRLADLPAVTVAWLREAHPDLHERMANDA